MCISARPIWLALEGVARGVCQFIGQNKSVGGRWVGLGGGEAEPAAAVGKKCDPSHLLPPCLPPWTSHLNPCEVLERYLCDENGLYIAIYSQPDSINVEWDFLKLH